MTYSKFDIGFVLDNRLRREMAAITERVCFLKITESERSEFEVWRMLNIELICEGMDGRGSYAVIR